MIIHPRTKEAYKLFHDGTLAFARMEQQGIRINTDYIQEISKEITKKVDLIEKDIYESKFYSRWERSVGGKKINIYSSQQLSRYLYKVLKLEVPKKTSKGNESTDEETLTQFGITELDKLIRVKKLKRMRDQYLDAFLREQVNGYVHPFFHLHLVTTFRSSSSDPNLQNTPKRDEELMNLVRNCIYPSKGNQFLELDFSQLEVRISAAYHNDPMMIKYIKDKSTDMHRDLAMQIFKLKKFNKEDPTHKVLRQAAKNGFVFPEFYGSYYGNCAGGVAVNWGKLPKFKKWKKDMGIPFEKTTLGDHMLRKGFTDLDSFANHLRKIENDFWNNRFGVYNQWKQDFYNEYLKKGFFHSKTGFTYQGNMGMNDVTNYPIQGSAFHVLIWSLIEGMKALIREKFKSKIVVQIHDSIIFDLNPKELKQIVNIMKCIMEHDTREHFKWINVPLEIEAELCEVDKSWATKKEFKIH